MHVNRKFLDLNNYCHYCWFRRGILIKPTKKETISATHRYELVSTITMLVFVVDLVDIRPLGGRNVRAKMKSRNRLMRITCSSFGANVTHESVTLRPSARLRTRPRTLPGTAHKSSNIEQQSKPFPVSSNTLCFSRLNNSV